MEYARLHGQEYHASEAPRAYNFRCPVCGAGVHLRRGEIRPAYFAHDPGEAKPECDLYYPGQGAGGASTSRPPLAVEGTPTEPALCLTPYASTRPQWGLFLRLPELDTADVGGATLRTLAEAKVVVSVGGREVKSLLAIYLRAGVGVGRVEVPPSATPYYITPAGTWPAAAPQSRWRTTAAGLRPAGTIFRLFRSEWTRLRAMSPVEWGEQLYVVAHPSYPPPDAVLTGSPMVAPGGGWTLWEVRLPETAYDPAARWLRGLQHEVLPPGWRIRFLTPPLRCGPDGVVVLPCRTPIVFTGATPVRPGAVELGLRSDHKNLTETVHPAGRDSLLYGVFGLATAGAAALWIGPLRDCEVSFRAEPGPSGRELARSLKALPRLRLTIAAQAFDPFGGPQEFTVEAAGAVPSCTLGFGSEDVDEVARLTVETVVAGRRDLRRGVTAAAARQLLATVLEGRKQASMTFDAGALGRVALQVRVRAPAARDGPDPRLARYLSAAAKPTQDQAPSWELVRRHGPAGSQLAVRITGAAAGLLRARERGR